MTAIQLLLIVLLASGDAGQEQSLNVEVEQLEKGKASTPSSAADLSIPNVVAQGNGNPATVAQLPGTLDAPPEHSMGESALVRREGTRNLAAEVARAAELIRQRGQQPTPEILAREIGPDALAAFLNQDPSALDAYTSPEDQQLAPSADPVSANGALIILPSQP